MTPASQFDDGTKAAEAFAGFVFPLTVEALSATENEIPEAEAEIPAAEGDTAATKYPDFGRLTM